VFKNSPRFFCNFLKFVKFEFSTCGLQSSSVVDEQGGGVAAWCSELSLSTTDSGISLSSSLATVVSSDKLSPLASSSASLRHQRHTSAAAAAADDDDDDDDDDDGSVAETGGRRRRRCHGNDAEKHVLHPPSAGPLADTALRNTHSRSLRAHLSCAIRL